MADALSPRHAVYAGSFDPLTLGHLDIIRRGAKLFDALTIGIGVNPDKKPLFPLDERVALIRDVLRDLDHVTVTDFTGLAVNFARDCGSSVLLRGMRALTDVEAEFTMSLANRALAPEIETVFLMSSEKYSHISSTLIKQIAQLGGAESRGKLTAFVPAEFIDPLLAKFA